MSLEGKPWLRTRLSPGDRPHEADSQDASVEEIASAKLQHCGQATVVQSGQCRLALSCDRWRGRAEGRYLSPYSWLTFSDANINPADITQAAYLISLGQHKIIDNMYVM